MPPPAKVDNDGDGHCAPGALDPQGICRSFKDCDDADNTRWPGATETCADVGVDNDCDGDKAEVDLDKDGVNDLGQICSSGYPGICTFGRTVCSSKGTIACTATIRPGQRRETCNGLDDDCDRRVDDGLLCTNGNTCAGVSGCRCRGKTACSGTSRCCALGCVNTSISTSSCGACGVKCGAGETCLAGRCRCGSLSGGVGAGRACAGTCSRGSCITCNALTNIALQATAYSSGGGTTSTNHGADEMNDGGLQSSCNFHWITASTASDGKYLEMRWTKTVTVGRVWFDTAPSSGVCGMSSGRTLAGGTLQYYSGGLWRTVGYVSGKTTDWSASFTPVKTTRLRLYNARATSVTGMRRNPMIFEWRVYCK